jgi:hypothetical protein
MMEAVRTSETSVDNYFTRQYIPEDNSELHTRRLENLKSHLLDTCYNSFGRVIIFSQRPLTTADNTTQKHKNILAPNGIRTCYPSNLEPGSSVSIVSGYGLDDRAIEVRYPAEAKGFFL